MALLFRLALVALASGVLACSSSKDDPSDGGGDGRTLTDAASDEVPRDAAKGDAADSGVRDGGTPSLLALSVTAASTSDGATPITLVPPFSPAISDYYVRCAAGTNVLSISMTASPGSEALVLLPIATASAPKQTLLMGVTEGQAIVAAATDGTATTEYWVRCLPHDFPEMRMTLHADAGAPTPGYYLVGNLVGQVIGYGAYAMILDGRGVPVWYARQVNGDPVYDVDDVVSGAVSYSFPFQIRQLSPASTTYVTVGGLPTDEHELRLLPNGDFLVLWSPIQTGVNLTGLVLPTPDGGSESFGPDGSIIACDIYEINPLGEVVWTWTATDHFDSVKDIRFLETPALTTGGPDGGPVVEPFHCNSIDVDTNGNLLVSARHMDSIFYIEKLTGKVLWKMGGAAYNKDHAVYVPVADPFHRQHDARLQPSWKATCSGGSGEISLFDDETYLDAAARAVIYNVSIGPGEGGAPPDCGITDAGGATGAAVAWQYANDVNSLAMGSFRILPDGTRLIGWGTNTTVAFTEVDVDKHDLLDFSFTDGNQSYRAIKVGLDAYSLNLLRSTAGQ